MDLLCVICLEPPKNKISLSCSHIFCYLCIKQLYISCNKKCPLCREDIDNNVYENAKEDEDKILENGYYWLYSGRNKGWWIYDDATCEIIEDAYTKFINDNNESSIDITIIGKEYIIDFVNMLQINKIHNNRTRKIRKVFIDKDSCDKNIKGISGLFEKLIIN